MLGSTALHIIWERILFESKPPNLNKCKLKIGLAALSLK